MFTRALVTNRKLGGNFFTQQEKVKLEMEIVNFLSTNVLNFFLCLNINKTSLGKVFHERHLFCYMSLRKCWGKSLGKL